MEAVMVRLVQLKHLLVQYNLPNMEVGDKPFAWECVNLDDIIADLKLNPEVFLILFYIFYILEIRYIKQ